MELEANRGGGYRFRSWCGIRGKGGEAFCLLTVGRQDIQDTETSGHTWHGDMRTYRTRRHEDTGTSGHTGHGDIRTHRTRIY